MTETVTEPTLPVIRTKKAFRDAIKKIPGSDGWWHSSGGDTFAELGERLTANGFTYDEAVDLLETAYSAVAGEFGN